MSTLYILNASPLSLFPARHRLWLEWWPLTTAEAAARVARHAAGGGPVRSALGHADLAGWVSRLLAYPLAHHRASAALGPGDRALVCQYRGPRLGEGSTRLPDGAGLDWYWLQGWNSLPGSPAIASAPEHVFSVWRTLAQPLARAGSGAAT